MMNYYTHIEVLERSIRSIMSETHMNMSESKES